MLDMDSDMAYIHKNKDLEKKENDKVITLEDIGIDAKKIPPKVPLDQQETDFHHSQNRQSPSSDMFEDISRSKTSVVLQEIPVIAIEELAHDDTEEETPVPQISHASDEEQTTSTSISDEEQTTSTSISNEEQTTSTSTQEHTFNNKSHTSELTFEQDDQEMRMLENVEAKIKEKRVEPHDDYPQESPKVKEIHLSPLPSHFQLSESLSSNNASDVLQQWHFEEKALENTSITDHIKSITIPHSLEFTDTEVSDEDIHTHSDVSLDVDELEAIESASIKSEEPFLPVEKDDIDIQIPLGDEKEPKIIPLSADEIDAIVSEGINSSSSFLENTLEEDDEDISLNAGELDTIENEDIDLSSLVLGDTQDKEEENLEEDVLSLDADEINTIMSESINPSSSFLEDTQEEDEEDVSISLDASELDIIASESINPSSSFLEDNQKKDSTRRDIDSIQSFHHYTIEIEHKARIMEIKLKKLILDNKQINQCLQDVLHKS